MTDVSRILTMIEQGDPGAPELLLPLVYEELRQLAAARMLREQPGQSLQATALVHEAWLKMMGPDGDRGFAGRRHFFSAAAEAMRQILVDRARRRLSHRHGGAWQRLLESPDVAAPVQDAEQTLAVHELLDRLAALYPRPAEVARMRFFLQMTFAEIGEILEYSSDTAESDWAFARAWLKREWMRE